MAIKRSVILRGQPIVNETGLANASIKPGYLVKGVTTIALHSTAGGNTPRTFALERDELGTGIDDTYTGPQNTGVGLAAYASGDTVKVGACHQGMQVTAWIGSGSNVAADDQLESAGDGTLRKLASGTPLARALEAATVAALTAPITIRVECF